MKPIGGYFELECGKTPPYYPDGIYLNLCRSGIRYLIRALGIKRLHVPFFTCHVVNDSIRQEGCEIIPYHLDDSLLPAAEFHPSDFIIYNNYFGVLGENVRQLAARYPNLIVDNAQAFYSSPNCRAAVYSPRKFFGLPDGGILRGKDLPVLSLPSENQSSSVSSHLLKRVELGAQAAYADFVRNDTQLEQFELRRMSPLTAAIMGNIDYSDVASKRKANFNYLRRNLPTDFPIAMAEDDVPLVYPLWLKDRGAELRDHLIRHNVFCARYWPNVLDETSEHDLEFSLARHLIAIPIDQRYGTAEMDTIINLIPQWKSA